MTRRITWHLFSRLPWTVTRKVRKLCEMRRDLEVRLQEGRALRFQIETDNARLRQRQHEISHLLDEANDYLERAEPMLEAARETP